MSKKNIKNNKLIVPKSDIITAAAKNLKKEIVDIISSGVINITLDLNKVEMIDSTGISVLISTHNSLKQKNGALVIINASNDILNLFTTMRLHDYFEIKGRE